MPKLKKTRKGAAAKAAKPVKKKGPGRGAAKLQKLQKLQSRQKRSSVQKKLVNTPIVFEAILNRKFIATIAEVTELSRKDVADVFTTLNNLAAASFT